MSIRFSRNNRYLPSDTFRIINSMGTIHDNQYKDCNFYYLFNLPQISSVHEEIRIRINEEIANFRWKGNLIESIKTRRDQIINSLKNSGFVIANFIAKCAWRLIIGLGASHPQETSMTLHHIYGIPYIPGSAIKGITKHWTVLKFAESNKRTDVKIEEAIDRVSKALETGEQLGIELDDVKFEELIEIFGTQKQAGKVIFMDAYPVDNINLKIDIMNVHYSDYYSGNQPPADWQNPNPIKFLTVEETQFQFMILSKDKNLAEKAKSLLAEALKEHGIGAKTSLGYGIFDLS
ncbi:MAG: type III-B CRISPR module RAMP protein Cmr6 [Thermodesulfovibrionales bacterium]|nr:type III-B CRISPR module RAMP protein Cmr6 [Thermodesulfovibrionales bacterium]